LHTTVVAANTQ